MAKPVKNIQSQLAAELATQPLPEIQAPAQAISPAVFSGPAQSFSLEDVLKIVSALPVSNSSGDLRALIAEMTASRPKRQIGIGEFKGKTPWSAADGEVKPKLKRKFFQHGIPVPEEMLKGSTIALANKLKPGLYFENWVQVTRRRDKGIDVTYKVKTPADRMVLPSRFGVTSIDQLLEGCIYQAANPKPHEEDLDSD